MARWMEQTKNYVSKSQQYDLKQLFVVTYMEWSSYILRHKKTINHSQKYNSAQEKILTKNYKVTWSQQRDYKRLLLPVLHDPFCRET